VSSGGGQYPVWRSDGKELYYLSLEGRMMAVEVNTEGATFRSGQPSSLFSSLVGGTGFGYRNYDVSGGRFLLVEPTATHSEVQPLTS
jgi:hypothetical protein